MAKEVPKPVSSSTVWLVAYRGALKRVLDQFPDERSARDAYARGLDSGFLVVMRAEVIE